MKAVSARTNLKMKKRGFARRMHQGQTFSICLTCFARIVGTGDLSDLEKLEVAHLCKGFDFKGSLHPEGLRTR